MDPQSEKFPSLSPYNYCADDPFKFIDPDGKDIIVKSDIFAQLSWEKTREEIIKTEIGRLVIDFLENKFKGVINIEYDYSLPEVYGDVLGTFKPKLVTRIKNINEITDRLKVGEIKFVYFANAFDILTVLEELCHAYDAAIDYDNFEKMVKEGEGKDYSEKPIEKSAKKKSKSYQRPNHTYSGAFPI